MAKKTAKKVCAVCYYVYGDKSKKLVSWCNVCKEYICPKCKNKPLLRLKAVAIKMAGKRLPLKDGEIINKI